MSDSGICEIIAVRHGETVANKQGVLQGQLDTPLNETGILQARAVSERLKKRKFDLAFTSDLNRAVTTANIIAEHHPELQVIPTPALREWNLGELQGRPYNELTLKYSEILNAFKDEKDIPLIPGGESKDEFQKRISTFMDDLAENNPGKKILLVSHGGAMQRMLVHTLGKTSPNNIIPLSANAGLSVFQYRDHRWRMICWNDTAHLENICIHETLTF